MSTKTPLDSTQPTSITEAAKANINKNEGEGSRTAAKAYNDATHDFVEAGKVGPAAAEARRAVDSKEAAILTAAEAKGKARARH